MLSPDLSRRAFVTAAGAALVPTTLSLPLRTAVPDGQGRPWDLAWLDSLRGDHKQLFDCGSVHTSPLHVAANYLEAARDVLRLEPPRVQLVIGIAYSAFPINARDELWTKYELGRRWEVRDPATGEWATRNIFLRAWQGPPPMREIDTVSSLMRRGAIFWQCYNALQGVAFELAADLKQAPQVVYAELEQGLNAGVRLVPAHTLLVGLVQERGCTYEKV